MRISDWSSDVCSSDLYSVHDPALQDLYARDMLTMFAPWRGSPVALLAVGDVEPGSWIAAFQEFVHTGRCPEHIRRDVAVYERAAAVQDDDVSAGGDHSSASDEPLEVDEHPEAALQREMRVREMMMVIVH